MQFSPDVQELAPNGERPDRLIGLNQTPKLQRAVELLEEDLTMTPSKKGNNFLIFPFLILEAKAAKSGDGDSKVKDQSSFAILTVLQIQLELAKKAGKDSKEDQYQGPLAWFIAYRGKNWELLTAFTETVDGTLKYVRLLLTYSISV